MDIQKISIIENPHYTITATYYVNTSIKTKDVIIYLHGGGFIFGHREDLPEEYLELFTSSGYGILAIDYLLAPESKLDVIISNLISSINWYQESGYLQLNPLNPNFYLFGRSAGAFLAIYLTTQLDPMNIKGIISLYGYFTLNEANFILPSRDFQEFNPVNKQMIDQYIQKQPLTGGPIHQRYLIYLYGRQTGEWLNLILNHLEDKELYSLTENKLVNLPPLFLAHGIKDYDVPIRQSRRINNLAKNSQLIEIDTDIHDFDRTDLQNLGIPIYKKIIHWLDEQNHNKERV